MDFKTLKVYLSPEKYEEVVSKAKQANMAASKYAANVLLGYEMAGTQEQEAIRELCRANTLFAKLTGLLKLGLKEHPDFVELRPLLKQIENEKWHLKKQYEDYLRRYNL